VATALIALAMFAALVFIVARSCVIEPCSRKRCRIPPPPIFGY
jgi:hypothetical protein